MGCLAVLIAPESLQSCFSQHGLAEHRVCKSEGVAWQCWEKQNHCMFIWSALHGLAEHRVCKISMVCLAVCGEAESRHFYLVCAAWIGCEACLLVARLLPCYPIASCIKKVSHVGFPGRVIFR